MKKMTISQIEAHYAPDIKAASDRQLFAVIRGDSEGEVPEPVLEALKGLARLELNKRGVALPDFSAFFAN